MNLKGKKLLICEEALSDYSGHFYSWIKAIRAVHLAADAEVLVASNQNIRREIQTEFGAIPAYSKNNWSGIYHTGSAWRRYAGICRHNLLVWRETRALLQKTGPVDCILLPAVRIHHLPAWRELCREQLGRSFQRLVLFLLTSQAVYDKEFQHFHFKKTSQLIKSVLRSFRREVEAGRVILAGDSHVTCREYETLSGVPFQVFPSPGAGLQAAQSYLEDPSQVETRLPTFTILGVSVIDKGMDILQNAILKLLSREPDLQVRFVIQWATPTVDYDGRSIPISDGLRQAPQVELIERTLNDEEYRGYFQKSDFLILPYRRKAYFNRISGVAIEAACAGIPMIVTENTWLAWALEQYGAGVTVKDGDADDLADKIRFCLQHADSLRRQAFNKKKIAMEENSSERYLQCIWK